MTVVLFRGDDPALLGAAVRERVAALVADGDRSLMVDDLGEAAYRTEDGWDLTALVEAAQTPPFLTERRIVVGRELGRFGNAEQLGALLRYLEAPLETTDLVLVWEKGPALQRLGAVPRVLVGAVEGAGGESISTSVGSGKAAGAWFEDQLRAAPVELDRSARAAIVDRLGEERGRLPGVLETLYSAFGSDATLTADDVVPFLGEAGSVPPWELTDAIAAGRADEALDRLARMLGPGGGRHPLQVMFTLHSHYERLLRLDGADVADERQAAALLGMKGSTFPAKKAMAQARRMGSARIARAIDLLGQADLDLRGARANDPVSTMEVLVARLCYASR